MNPSGKKEDMQYRIAKVFNNDSKDLITRHHLQDSENYNMFLSSLFSQTVVKTLTAPLLRLRYVQQTAYESIASKPKTIKITEAYNRMLKRNSVNAEPYGTTEG